MKVVVVRVKPYTYEIFNESGISMHIFREERDAYLEDVVREWLSSFNEYIEVDWRI